MKTGLALNAFVNRDLTTEEVLPDTVLNPTGGAVKRGFDISIATIAIIVFLPIMTIVMFLIWWHDRGNPLFGHTRIGCGGRSFKCLKFRSMVPNSSEVLAALLKSDPEAAREWAETQKLRQDPRITPIGRLLRLSSLDELPQLFNVLRGDMSIVGPRPIVAGEIERYGTHFEQYRGCRPGVTGLWQVSGRSDCSYTERVRYDVLYASRWSLMRDLAILLKTVPAVLGRKGSC